MQVDLTDPTLFAGNDFWPVLAHLRRTDPVHRHPEPGGGGFWVVTRHADVVAVYADQESYSSRYGMRLGSTPEAVAAVAQRMLIVSDPPDHTQLKRILAQSFAPAEMPALERLVREVVGEVIAAALDGGERDFLDVAKQIPNQVVSAMMGIPPADRTWIGTVTTEAFEGGDEATRAAAHGEIFLYFSELLAGRRRSPGTDFVSRIAAERRQDGPPGRERPLSDEEIVFNCNGVLAGANETTRYSAAGGLLALIENPDQWAALRSAGPEGVPAAVEEILRWTVPGIHAMRTVVRPTGLDDTRFDVGDRVTVWNASANRDEAVFADGDRFLVNRTPNRHVSFGAGRHLCLGARLARLELAVLLEELLARVDAVELTGRPAWTASNFTWGLTSLPVRLQPVRRRRLTASTARE